MAVCVRIACVCAVTKKPTTIWIEKTEIIAFITDSDIAEITKISKR